MPVSKEVLDEVALSEAEYQLIVDKLGREPTHVEVGMFGSLWSEHCGYKHSRALLKLFPTSGKRVLCKPGEENAGAVDIGDGLVIVMKVESHNHPSAIEPFQGAATGVGGIVRDIFTMGAFPIALLNSLRFGPLDEGRNREIRRLLARVGHKVLRLVRIGIGPLRLGNLAAGEYRRLGREEVRALRRAAKIRGEG